jgi:uncharacterized membrane-anchored protein
MSAEMAGPPPDPPRVEPDAPTPPVEACVGAARLDRRTKHLLGRLKPGDVAIIDHADLDRLAAEGLVAAGVSAVVNAARSTTGRYPNTGPLVLAEAGVALVDDVGEAVFAQLKEGDEVTVVGGEVCREGTTVATGERLRREEVAARLDELRRRMGDEIERFAENTLGYLRQEKHLLIDEPDLPEVPIDFHGRHVLIVVRGADYRADLAMLASIGYLSDVRPLLVGVDGGADALLEAGYQPDLIVGDFDSVSEQALRSGATLVVHAYPGGRAPGADRLDEMGLEHIRFPAAGTSEDIAMLLAFERGAELIVAVGTHTSMVDFLDKGRNGMASTFLVRLKVGAILVDAKGVSRLYRTPQVRKRDLVLMIAAALFTLVLVTMINEPMRLFLRSFWLTLR